MNTAIKLALNGTYGKSNDKWSFFYDPKYTMSITINGQLLLAMLIEELAELKDITVLQANTDGVTVKIPKEELSKLQTICSDWEKLTQLELECNYYQKMVIRDVNNFIAQDVDGHIKDKGLAFEIDKAIYKNHSMRIVRIALANYFINYVPIELTLRDHLLGNDYQIGTKKVKNHGIFDFCLSYKGNKDWSLVGKEEDKEYKYQKTNRYYITNSGVNLFKNHSSDGRVIGLQVGWEATIFNKYVKQDTYDINYDFYTKECQKIIKSIENDN